MSTDSPDLVIAKRLLDHLKLRGFQFQRTAPGADGPLVGNRVTGPWTDTIHIQGFSRDCYAWRKRTGQPVAGTAPSTASMAEPNTSSPSADGPVSGSMACSGCGMSPTTRPSAEATPAMSFAAPFGVAPR